jgi:hypothetical protein
MKILCVADQMDPLVYSSAAKERFGGVDLVLAAGDVPMDYLGFLSSALNRPIYFVFGNHNLEKISDFNRRFASAAVRDETSPFLRQGYGAVYTGWRNTRHDGRLLISGLGGSMRYNDGLNQYTDFQMCLKALRLVPGLLWNRLRYGRFLDILLTHAPPRGIGDAEDACHRGFGAFLPFMRIFRPRYLIHGHIHLYDLNAERKRRYHATEVVNAYGHTVIEFRETS